MPTDETVNASDDSVADAAGSQSTRDVSEIPLEELAETHPEVAKLIKDKHAADRLKLDKQSLEKKNKKLKSRIKSLSKDEDEDQEDSNDSEYQEDNSYLTKEEFEIQKWELINAKDIEVYGDETYKEEIENGVPPAIALKYAKQRFSTSDNTVEKERAASVSSSRTTNREGGEPVTLTEYDKRFGLTPERKAELDKKYPGLAEA